MRWNRILLILILVGLIGGSPVLAGESASEDNTSEALPPVTRIIIDRDDMQLYAFSEARVLFELPVAVGLDTSPTPVGRFYIKTRKKNPWYTPSYKKPVPPGDEENPIGARWLGFNKPGYGIHGTNEPESILRRASLGCIRMNNHDIKRLFPHVHRGTPVKILDDFSLIRELSRQLRSVKLAEELRQESG